MSILLFHLTSSAPALADNVADAKAKFRAGATAYREGRFKDAIDLFLQANKLDPHAELLFNVGQAYERTGDVADALRSYREYLRLAAVVDDRPAVEKLVVGLEQKLRARGVQQVTVLSDPPGARVFLDGAEIGGTPTTFEARPGKHALVLKSPGRPDAARDIDLPEDRAIDVDVKLPPFGAPGASPSTGPSGAPAPSASPSSAFTAGAPSGPAPARGIALVKPWTWGALGAGAVGFGAALGFEAARAAAESAARADPTQVGYRDKYDAMLSHQTASRVLAGVSAAAVLAGGVLLVLDLRAPPAAPATLALGCGPTTCALSAAGRF